MDQDRLDKFIKKQVEEHKTPSDPDLLWQKIQAKQNQEKKPKRKLFIYWLRGGACLLASMALIYICQFSNTTNDQQDSTVRANETAIDQSQSVEKTKEIYSDLTTKNNTEENTNDNNSTPTLSSNLEINDKKPKTPFIDNTTVNRVDTKSTSATINRKTEATTLAGTKQTKPNDHFATAKNATKNSSAFDTNQTTNQMTKDDAPIKKQAEIDDKNTSITTANDVNPIRETIVKTEQNEDKSNNLLNDDSSNLTAFAKSELMPIANMYLFLDEQIMDIALVELMKEKKPIVDDKNEDKDKEKQKEKNWSFSNGATFTYGKGFRTLSAKASAPSNYVETRNDMETSLDAFRINLDFVMQYKNGCYIKSGLEYEQINERFESYVEWDSTEIDPEQVIAIYYNIDGEPMDRKGEGVVSTRYWLQKKKFNRYRSIDIPLLVGYQSKQEDKRLGWFIEGGASINIWFKPSGEIFSATDQPLDLKENANLFKTQTGISLLGAAGLTYQVADNFSLWASPEIKYHLNSITTDINTLDQKYLNAGLKVGIRYHW